MVNLLKDWQKIEKDSVEHCGKIMDRTKNPLVRQIMEILRNDSTQHHRVQQFLIDSLTKSAITLTPEELSDIWKELEAHDKMEKETIKIAQKLKRDCRFFVQRALLDYLITDEQKHDALFEKLDEFKRQMSPYG